MAAAAAPPAVRAIFCLLMPPPAAWACYVVGPCTTGPMLKTGGDG